MVQPLYYDRVKETTTIADSGAYTLDGAVAGFGDFTTIVPTGSYFYYCAEDGTEWETAIGFFNESFAIERHLILDSSSAGSPITWTAGTKNIFLTKPASAIRQLDIDDQAPSGSIKVSDSGNMGLGTDTPISKLHVHGTGVFAGTGAAGAAGIPQEVIQATTNYDVNSNNTVGIGMITNDTYASKCILAFERTSSGGRGKFHILNTNATGENKATLTQSRLTVTHLGNVGVNNTNPSTDFHVSGTITTDDLTANQHVNSRNIVGTNFVSRSNEDYTCSAGEHVVYTATSASGTLTLPIAPSGGDVCSVTADNITAPYTVTVTGTTKEINLREGSATSFKLFITNDNMRLQYNGTDWDVLHDGRILHRAGLSNSVAQSGVSHQVWTLAEMDTNSSHSNMPVDLTNERVVALRAGMYQVIGQAKFDFNVVAAGDRFLCRIDKNGSVYWQTDNMAGGVIHTQVVSGPVKLAAGDYVDLKIWQGTGGLCDTESGTVWWQMMEIA